MKADPTRPYKMYAAMASAALTTGIAEWADAPIWAVVTTATLISALAVYLTPNPLVIG